MVILVDHYSFARESPLARAPSRAAIQLPKPRTPRELNSFEVSEARMGRVLSEQFANGQNLSAAPGEVADLLGIRGAALFGGEAAAVVRGSHPAAFWFEPTLLIGATLASQVSERMQA